MDYLLLLLAVSSLVATINALRPWYRPPRRALVSFALGFLVNETPIWHLLLQVIVVSRLLAPDTLVSPVGLAALTMFIASWVGLAVVAARARLAVPAVARALAGLKVGLVSIPGVDQRTGADLREHGEEGRAVLPGPDTGSPENPAALLPTQAVEREVLPALDPSLPASSRWWIPKLPFPIRPREVVRHRDIVFARPDGVPLHLDVYHLRQVAPQAPVLMYIHGGGWILGSKNEQGLPLIYRMARRGWVVVATNYRLSPRATFPDHLVDLKLAMKWIREHVADHGGNPLFVAVSGNSAGGHLAALFALTAGDRRYQPGFEEVDTSVEACVPYYGIHDFTDRFGHWPHRGMRTLLKYKVMKCALEEQRARWEEASPLHRLGPVTPPFLVVHGDHDTLVPVHESRRFVEAFRSASPAPLGYIEVPGAQHAFEVFPSVREEVVNEGVARFLDAVHAHWTARHGPAAG